MPLFQKKQKLSWEPDRLPRHIAIIMDGNGRWAAKRALPRSAGHAVGAETFRRVATYCKDIGIKFLTVYAFSTENWKRSADEINTLMEILEKYLHEALRDMERDKIRFRFSGDVSALSPKLRKLIEDTEELSTKIEGVLVNLCINYGGRDEILRAAGNLARDMAACGTKAPNASTTDNNPSDSAGLDPADVNIGALLTEENFSKYMYTSGMPDPDLIIRPSGEMRLSNFLLWQAAYSEFYFTDVLWPDFNERELDRAIISYQSRQRRYGGT